MEEGACIKPCGKETTMRLKVEENIENFKQDSMSTFSHT